MYANRKKTNARRRYCTVYKDREKEGSGQIKVNLAVFIDTFILGKHLRSKFNELAQNSDIKH